MRHKGNGSPLGVQASGYLGPCGSDSCVVACNVQEKLGPQFSTVHRQEMRVKVHFTRILNTNTSFLVITSEQNSKHKPVFGRIIQLLSTSS